MNHQLMNILFFAEDLLTSALFVWPSSAYLYKTPFQDFSFKSKVSQLLLVINGTPAFLPLSKVKDPLF